ncbi:hypothetical protein D9758_018070 [Tetrapyrgos nigripes]|uniref:CCHC-type domain-containing protein n=1 Tax=Tetrapyrgos nigripes TaxID=182062 RepID=A0A8H5FFF0_9AGAR|nr:hypothetical protein D9758_018070 [Tetrapyrgos nigripes]
MFTAKPTIYETEASKVTFASSYLTGAAARYYQNLVEREALQGAHLAALHNWRSFIRMFSRLFGVHDEQLYSQAALDRVQQKANKTFADFLVRFEDASLLTQYNEPALRWKLLLQIRKDLRNRLTVVRNIPQGFNALVDRLLDLDTAREAFNEAGLVTNTYPNPTYTVNSITAPRTRITPQNAQAGPGPSTQANRNRARASPNSTPPAARAAQVQPNKRRPFVRLPTEEYQRRMKNGLCIRCGANDHFGRDCPPENDPVEVKAEAARVGIIIEENENETYFGYDEEGNMVPLGQEGEEEATEEQGNKEGAQDDLPGML